MGVNTVPYRQVDVAHPAATEQSDDAIPPRLRRDGPERDGAGRLWARVPGHPVNKAANGRAISTPDELAKLGKSCDEFACYDVEVCPECRWNHLRRQSLHGRLHAS